MKRQVFSVIVAAILLFQLLLPVSAAKVDPIIVEPMTQSRTSGFAPGYTITGNGAADIVSIALSQEGRNGSQFGYTEEWCADFVSDCAIIAGQSAAIPQYGGVEGLKNRIINAGGWISTSSPKPGDICFIDWDKAGGYQHVEIVYAVSGTTVSTIGGNSGSGSSLYTRSVKKHAPLSSGYVTCIVRPNYSSNTIPGKPVLKNFSHTYASGSTTVFTWDSTENTTHYNMYVDLQQADGTWERTYTWHYANSGYSYAFSDGIYRVLLQSTNSNADGWPYTDGDWETFVVGAHTHDKGSYAFYEAVHPHCDCYRCSICGEIWRDTTSSNYMESCLECHRPDKPVIVGLGSSYLAQETITISWTVGANTTHCNYWLYKKDGDSWNTVHRIDYADSPVTENLDVGEYRVLIVGTNSDFWEEDGSTWLWIDSDYAYFTVVSREAYRPEKPVVSVNGSYLEQSPVTISWIVGANTTHCNYWLYKYNGSEWEVVNRIDYADSPVTENLDVGEYRALVVGSNSNYYEADGSTWLWIDSDYVYFTITHNYQDVVTDPTCTEPGHTTYTCSICGDSYTDTLTEALGHDYVEGVCSRCGEPDPDYVIEAKLTVYGNPVTAAPGSTIQVPIMITGGEGFAGFTLIVMSSEGLTLTGIEKGALLKNADGMLTPNVTNRIVNWTSSTNTTGEGELLVLTFALSESVEEDAELTISILRKDNKASNFADANENPVSVRFEDIIVTAQSVLSGDVNGDGEVDTIDSIRLVRFLVDLVELTESQQKAADVNHDGDITTTDAIRLAKYLVGIVDTLEAPKTRSIQQETSVAVVLASDVIGVKGTIVTVPVTITGNTGFAGFTFEVNYPDTLELTMASVGEMLKNEENSVFTFNTSKRLVSWICTSNVDEDGELFTLTFKIVKDIEDPAEIWVTAKNGIESNFADENGRTVFLNIFKDMPEVTHWSYNAINWAVMRGITAGTSRSTFSPNTECTRAQAVTFLWRSAGEPEPQNMSNPFRDVTESDYYFKAVLWAAETGVTAGATASTFSPNAPCTRAQIVTFLWRAAGSPDPIKANIQFLDIKEGSYYEKAVLWASSLGITNGTSINTFSPNVTCTRAQIVSFLYREK